MNILRSSNHGAGRYVYDFQLCTSALGWAQIDTSQDASYYGQWINPSTRTILAYCEGDVIETRCDNNTELCTEIAVMKAWNEEQGHRFAGIDGMCNPPLIAALTEVGLTQYLY